VVGISGTRATTDIDITPLFRKISAAVRSAHNPRVSESNEGGREGILSDNKIKKGPQSRAIRLSGDYSRVSPARQSGALETKKLIHVVLSCFWRTLKNRF
jgi:hypothetical protein